MKMAKPSEKDIDAAGDLMSLLDQIAPASCDECAGTGKCGPDENPGEMECEVCNGKGVELRAIEALTEAGSMGLSEFDKESLRIGQAIQRAARQLPYGWDMSIEVERGYGGVKLVNEEGADQGDFHDHDGLSYSIAAAIDAAIAGQPGKDGGAA